MTLQIKNGILSGFTSPSDSETLTVPAGIHTIGRDAFARSDLTGVHIPEGVEVIEEGAFYLCDRLRHVTLPRSLKTIGPMAFTNAALEALLLPDGLTEIGDEAFSCAFAGIRREKTAYMEDIRFPTSLKKIGLLAFCSLNCRRVVLPEGLEELGAGAFSGSDMEELVIPGSLKVIPERAFEFCGRLRKVRICSGVEAISADAFAECGELREIQMDEGVKQINQRAFFRCDKLGKIRKGD